MKCKDGGCLASGAYAHLCIEAELLVAERPVAVDCCHQFGRDALLLDGKRDAFGIQLDCLSRFACMAALPFTHAQAYGVTSLFAA